EFDRRRGAARVAQLPAAAGRALRTMRHVVLDGRRTQQIMTDDVIVEIGTKSAGNRLGDLKRCKRNRALSKRAAHQWRGGDHPRIRAVEESLDLAIADHAIEQT